jgi:Leucine-rich repeat (LRR) protein
MYELLINIYNNFISGGALQKNRALKELCLANNELNSIDAFNIGNILKNNYHLQLLDISNNNIEVIMFLKMKT